MAVREANTSGSHSAHSESSGTHDVKRKRVMGPFDAASATRAIELLLEKSLHGSIVVSDGKSDLCFFFTRGGLRVIALGRQLPSLCARLITKGAITQADAAKVQGVLRAPKKEVGPTDRKEERDVIVEVLRLSSAEVDEVAKEIVSDVFLDTLFWDDPQHEAGTGEPDPEILGRRDLSALTLSLGVKELVQTIQQRIRTATELRRTVTSLQVVVEPLAKAREAASAGGKIGDGPQAAARTRLVQRAVAEPGLRASDLMTRLELGELETASLLHDLVSQGYVKLDRKPLAKEEEQAKLRAMEEALDQALSQLLRRVKVAQEAASTGDKERAGRHLARAGGLLLKDGRDEEAVRTFSGALEMAPDNIEGREGYVQSLWATNRSSEAVAQSEALGAKYLELNLPQRARRVLEKVLGKEERTSSLDLLVKAYVKLRQPKAAAEAGQRLVNRLRREGKPDEARDVAAGLMDMASEEDRAKLLCAAGADKTKVAALAGVTVALIVLFFPAQQALASRQELAESIGKARSDLAAVKTLAEAEASLRGIEDRFTTLADAGGAVGEEAGRVKERVAAIRADAAQLLKIAPLFPWDVHVDLAYVEKQVESLPAQTTALVNPRRRVLDEIRAFRERADAAREQLLHLDASPEALALAARTREEFLGLPDVLGKILVKIRVTTVPPGATVKWDGTTFQRVTPVELGVPLMGTKELVLTLDGHEPEARTIEFSKLDGYELKIRLDRARSMPDRPATERPPPTPQPPPTDDPPDRDPIRGPVVGTPNDPNPPPQPVARAQIEFRDGAWEGTPDTRYTFEFDPRTLATVDAEARFRATVEAVHRLEGTNVRLVGLRVWLEVRGAGGVWKKEEKPFELELDEPHTRAVKTSGGNRYQVGPVLRTPHMKQEWFLEQAKKGVAGAVRLVKIRERDRLR